MNSHHGMVKEQLLHMLFGTLIFVVIGSVAVGLDLAAAMVKTLGVSPFTSTAIEFTAHGMLLVDLVLFVVYLGRSSWALCQEMFK